MHFNKKQLWAWMPTLWSRWYLPSPKDGCYQVNEWATWAKIITGYERMSKISHNMRMGKRHLDKVIAFPKGSSSKAIIWNADPYKSMIWISFQGSSLHIMSLLIHNNITM